MRITCSAIRKTDALRSAFALVEVLISVVVMSVVFAGFFVSFAQGFAQMQVARENLRATQILQQQMETIRLYTWDQINTSGFIPTTYYVPFDIAGSVSTVAVTNALVYQVQTAIGSVSMPDTTYADDHRKVTFTLTWTSGTQQRQRQMTTFVSKYGLHNYYY
jgi:Tfp pilus assembly protein PilV